jgi:hypothetical protein
MLALLSLLIMTVKIVAISLVAIAPAAPAQASEITSSTVIELANAARQEGGLAALKPNSLLSSAAQAKANDMLAKQYFAHNTPDGKTPWDFIKAVGYSYVTAGENLAIDFTEAESIQTAWMNSPGHRANIMNSSFQEIGIGISKGMYNGHQTTIVVQMFGTPIGQKVSLPSTPTPVAKAAPTPAPAPVAQPAPHTQPVAQQPGPQMHATTVPESQAPTAQPTPTYQAPLTSTGPDTQSNTQPTTIGYQPVEITSTDTSLQGNNLYLTVTASNQATKLLATYGEHTVMLDPAADNQWYGYIPLAELNSHTNLIVSAYDINGNLTHQPVAQFSSELNASLKDGSVEGASVTILGKTINPNAMQEKVILLILAALLATLGLAIGIRRHVQHVGLIANTAFVAMLAAFMLIV